jgi:hypothetical protein
LHFAVFANFHGEMNMGSSQLEILSGWKQIANYMEKGVRTVQRYERELALPVRRPAGKSGGSVIATSAELDAWVKASPIRDQFELKRPGANSEMLQQLKRNVELMSRLRTETQQARQALSEGLELLRANILAMPTAAPRYGSTPQVRANVLSFDTKREEAQ